MLNVEAQSVVNAHVLVGHPDEGEEGNEVSSPIRVQQFVPGDEQHSRRDIVAKTILTSEQVEEFAADERLRLYAFSLAVLARLPKHFFVRHGPGDARDRHAEH